MFGKKEKRKQIIHIVAKNEKTELHIKKVFDKTLDKDKKFMKDHVVIVSYEGQIKKIERI